MHERTAICSPFTFWWRRGGVEQLTATSHTIIFLPIFSFYFFQMCCISEHQHIILSLLFPYNIIKSYTVLHVLDSFLTYFVYLMSTQIFFKSPQTPFTSVPLYFLSLKTTYVCSNIFFNVDALTTSTFGKSKSLRTSKCLSFVTIKLAFAATAQSTNLLSSLSVVIIFQL
jgi:hypothetical protein